ncbi:zinc finger BED domain-containing protein 5-like [Homarus americanus]|uniref:zinc finger BED domain-containing protein 5-like n=1 Tax=Homarus americanus TaxID=6706 RepID=UPI001C493A28|nr:zinc finger BED domain-containing protein 5-like [Homarus americanus]
MTCDSYFNACSSEQSSMIRATERSRRNLEPIMSVKKRGYDHSYIEYGFTSIIINGEERPQCVICSKALTNDSMKPTKLRRHLQNVHPQHKDKDQNFFERHGNALKKMKLDSTGAFKETNQEVTEASYVVALEIAKQKKPHTIGENLIKPCSLKMVEIVLGN